MDLDVRQEELSHTHEWDFSDLRALFLSCTLKRSPEVSHTEGLAKISMEIMQRNHVNVEMIRIVDHDVPPGVYPDMTQHGFEHDEWPEIYAKVSAADILIAGIPYISPRISDGQPVCCARHQ